jgi:hypothetical protein
VWSCIPFLLDLDMVNIWRRFSPLDPAISSGVMALVQLISAPVGQAKNKIGKNCWCDRSYDLGVHMYKVSVSPSGYDTCQIRNLYRNLGQSKLWYYVISLLDLPIIKIGDPAISYRKCGTFCVFSIGSLVAKPRIRISNRMLVW